MIKLSRNGVRLEYTVADAIHIMSQMPLQEAIEAVLDNEPEDIAELMVSYPKKSPYFQFLIYLISKGWEHESNREIGEAVSRLLNQFPYLSENIREILYSDSDVFFQFFENAVLDKATWERLVQHSGFQERIQVQMQEIADLKVFGPNTSLELMELLLEHKVVDPNVTDIDHLSPLSYAKTEEEKRLLITEGADTLNNPEYLIIYYDLGNIDKVKKYIHDNLSPLSRDSALPTEIIKLLSQIIESEKEAKRQDMLEYFVKQDPLFKKWRNILKKNFTDSDAELLTRLLNYQDPSGESALMIVYERRGIGHVQLFLELGADINQKGKNGVPFIVEILKAPAGTVSKAIIKNNLLSHVFKLDPKIESHTATELMRQISGRAHEMTGAVYYYLVKHGADLKIAIDNPLSLGYVLDSLSESQWGSVLDQCDLAKIMPNAEHMYIVLSRIDSEDAPDLFALIRKRLGDDTVKALLADAKPATCRSLEEILPDLLSPNQDAKNNNNNNNNFTM